ncbi:MAG: ABC transporter permease [Actinobacteria bacterium]|nr:ABC transporter permease [Actinomycetota bacterium]
MAKQATDEISTADRVDAGGPRTDGVARLATALWRRREASIALVAILLLLYFQSSNDAFLSQGNIRGLAQSGYATAIIACGLVMLLICGEIDLSVGSVMGFAPIIVYLADQEFVFPIAVVVALLVTSLVGLLNGVITVYLRVPSFVTTLGTLFLLTGLNVTLTDGFPKPAPEESGLTRILGGGAFSGIAWALIIVVLMHLLLTRTRWGLHTFAVGGNLVGASEAGVRVNRVKIGNFMLCSALGGFAGIMEAIRINSVDPLAGGPNVMFLAVSAAVIGGTALAGGAGTIIGAFFGTAVLAILRNGFTLQGVSANTFNIILGISILVAMTLNVYVGRLRRSGKT